MEAMEDELTNSRTTEPNHPVKDRLQRSVDSVRDTANSCCESVSKETGRICDSTTEGIRNNPVASVVGAAVFGAAVTYFILKGTGRPASFSERYLSHPLEEAGSSLSSAFNNLRFW